MARGSSVQRSVNSVRRNLRRMGKDVKKEVIKTLEDIALDLADKALNLAPVDTGRLRKSADPEVIVSNNKARANVTFSAIDPKTGYDYALIQHEDLSFKHPRGGQAKYLEQPLRRNSGRYRQELEKAVKKVTK